MFDSPLQLLDESFSRVLAIVAHPDDLEYGTAAAVARWTAQGKQVVYCLATSGEAGIDGIEPERCGPLREAEERAGAALVGVDTVEFLGYPDGVLEYGLDLRRDIARVVRRYKPDAVITGNHHETWSPGVYNQADHIALGRAVIDGVRDAANRWVFRDLADEGLEPWRAPQILVPWSPVSTHAVDVTETFDAGVSSLLAHSEYMRGLGSDPMSDPAEFLTTLTRPVGASIGTRYGVAIEVIAAD
jgi:LmbE family N-acetylglucosaminyl deacetylase